MAHRRCIKKFIIANYALQCDKCLSNYAAGYTKTFLINQIKPKLISALLWKSFQMFLLCIAVALVIIYLARADTITTMENLWRFLIIFLCSVILFLVFTYLAIIIREFSLSIGIKDIEIFCNQTEIARHNKNSRETLENYLEKIYNNNFNVSGVDSFVRNRRVAGFENDRIANQENSMILTRENLGEDFPAPEKHLRERFPEEPEGKYQRPCKSPFNFYDERNLPSEEGISLNRPGGANCIIKSTGQRRPAE